MPGKPKKNRINHVTENVNQVSRAGRYMTCRNCWEKGHNKARCYNKKKRPKPQLEKRKPCRKSKNAAYHPFNPINDAPSQSNVDASADPHTVPNADPHTVPSAYPSVSYTNVADSASNQSFTGLLNTMEQHRMDAEITDAEIFALADMNEAEEREARRKDGERVLEEAKRMGVYRKRGACRLRGPYERIRNQKRKKEDLNGPGKQPDTTLDVSD
ncbi:hypothetical protein Tco_0696814 [Tanacetum coccineum]